MFNYITEPNTNKKYSIFSKNGKQLLKKYVQLFFVLTMGLSIYYFYNK